MKAAILLYDGFTALDCVGPYEVLAQNPALDVSFVADRPRIVPTDTRHLRIEATRGYADVGAADILLVPGGSGDELALADEQLVGWVRRVHEGTTWTTSVCTGSLILGAAGILQGKRATTHWMRRERLKDFGALVTIERVVEDGKVVTAAGVSAGIDMGLHLLRRIAGDEAAQSIQLALEYDPQPAFDAGSPERAPADIVAGVRGVFDAAIEQRRQQIRS